MSALVTLRRLIASDAAPWGRYTDGVTAGVAGAWSAVLQRVLAEYGGNVDVVTAVVRLYYRMSVWNPAAGAVLVSVAPAVSAAAAVLAGNIVVAEVGLSFLANLAGYCPNRGQWLVEQCLDNALALWRPHTGDRDVVWAGTAYLNNVSSDTPSVVATLKARDDVTALVRDAKTRYGSFGDRHDNLMKRLNLS